MAVYSQEMRSCHPPNGKHCPQLLARPFLRNMSKCSRRQLINHYHECRELALQVVRSFFLLEVFLQAHALQSLSGLEPGQSRLVRRLRRCNLYINKKTKQDLDKTLRNRFRHMRSIRHLCLPSFLHSFFRCFFPAFLRCSSYVFASLPACLHPRGTITTWSTGRFHFVIAGTRVTHMLHNETIQKAHYPSLSPSVTHTHTPVSGRPLSCPTRTAHPPLPQCGGRKR